MAVFKKLFNSCTDEKRLDYAIAQYSEDLPKASGDMITSQMDTSSRLKLHESAKSTNIIENIRENLYFQGNGRKNRDEPLGWNDLPNEMKHKIISKMDYFTRLEFSLCSKSNNRNVKRANANIHSMKIQDKNQKIDGFYEDKPVKYVELVISFYPDRLDELWLRFVERTGEDGNCDVLTLRQSKKYKSSWYQQTGVHEYDNHEMVAFNTIKRFLTKSDLKLEQLNIEMDHPSLQFIFNKSYKYITDFEITSKDVESLSWWLTRLKSLNSLEISISGMENQNYTKPITQLSSIETSYKRITFQANSRFTEEQFFALNATDIYVTIKDDETSNLNENTINQFIKKWKAGEIRSDFSILFVCVGYEFEEDELLEELEAKQWDDEFHQEWDSFCEDFVNEYNGFNLFQITNNENTMTATLQFFESNIYFVVTGKLEDGRIVHRVPKSRRTI